MSVFQMVWEQSCELIIMLTEVVENGKVGTASTAIVQLHPILHSLSFHPYVSFLLFSSSLKGEVLPVLA